MISVRHSFLLPSSVSLSGTHSQFGQKIVSLDRLQGFACDKNEDDQLARVFCQRKRKQVRCDIYQHMTDDDRPLQHDDRITLYNKSF